MQALQPSTNSLFKFNSELIAYGFLLIMVAFIPISKAVVSLAEALLAVSWLIGFSDAEIRQRRLSMFKTTPYLWAFPLFYCFYALGLLYTSDLSEGLRELNAKHYFFSLPLMVITLKMTRDQLRWIFLSFAIANVLVAVSVFYIIATGNDFLHGSTHIPSAFEQRPRASLFLCFSIFILAEYLRNKWKELSNEAITALFIFSAMLLAGLILMKGRIGQLGFVVLSPLFVVYYLQSQRKSMLRWLVAAMLTVALGAGLYFGFDAVRQPFDEALNEYRESQLGYPSSEPTYSSIGMRVAYYEEYWPLFLENLWIGVGTGDLIHDGRPLFEDQRFKIPFQKPHNQFLETAIQFGLLGLVFLLAVWAMAIRSFNPAFRHLGYLFSLLLFVSMWSDSTLGTQGGISFFMLFTTLFLVRPNDPVFVKSDPNHPSLAASELKADGLRS
ncbi:MAG: hypothetical protein C0424_00595 [Sphingobacteriaceae bacterium]|nr:hypothetical protein [Sphingobacteriaceae bacterium]